MSAFPAVGLMDGVSAVRQLFGLCVAFLVTDKGVTDAFVCVIKTPCAFEPELKRGSFFGCFDFGLSLIGVLNDFNIALDNVLIDAENALVMLYGVILSFCPYRINGIIEQIALGQLNLLDSPIISSDIFLCGEFAVFIGCISVNELVTVINAVLCSGKSSVALCLLCFGIDL